MRKQPSMRGVALAFSVSLVLLGAAVPVAAEEPSRWEFEVVPYGWIFANFGTLDVKGRSATVDDTVLDNLKVATSGNAFAAAGYFSARYDRWSVFVDAFGGYAEESASQKIPTNFCTLCVAGKVKLKPVFVDFALGYRLGQWSLAGRRHPMSLGVYAGTRYMLFYSKLSASAKVVSQIGRSATVSTTFEWADPMIGVRWEVPVLDRVSAEFRGDIGGFGASSHLIWGLVGGVKYWLPWRPFSVQPWLGAGYRLVDFDRDFGAGNSISMQFRGPYSSLGLLF